MTPSCPALVGLLTQGLVCVPPSRSTRLEMFAGAAGVVIIAAAAGLLSVPSIASDGSAGKARNLASACAMCHGTNGFSAGGMPSLAGQPTEYLETQLRDFRSGKRSATIMHQITKGYSDQELAILANYFTTQRPAQASVAAPPGRLP